MIKYGDLNENSRSDDDPSKKAAAFEKDGFRVLSKEAAAKAAEITVIAIGTTEPKGANRGGDRFPTK